MRTIKFRAWDKSTNKLLEEGFHILGEVTCFNIIGMRLSEVYPNENTLELLNKVEIEQFSGLTDKNGKEIYEGDILKYQHNTSKWLVSYTSEVRFKNGAFYSYWEREMLGKLEHHWDLLSKTDKRYHRIIGNRHENKELL